MGADVVVAADEVVAAAVAVVEDDDVDCEGDEDGDDVDDAYGRRVGCGDGGTERSWYDCRSVGRRFDVVPSGREMIPLTFC